MTLPKCSPISDAAGVTLPVLIASELLKWASKDATRSHLCGFGYATIGGQPYLAATNGHVCAALPMEGTSIGAPALSCWPADYIATQIALAKAVKAPTIVLAWDKVRDRDDAKFPLIDQVIPAPFPKQTSTCTFAGNYIAACGDLSNAFDRVMSPKGRSMSDTNAAIAFRGLGSTLDPLRVDVLVEEHVVATIVVMPTRTKAPEGKEWPIAKSKWDRKPGEDPEMEHVAVEVAA